MEDKEKEIQKVRAAYKALNGYSAKMWINKRYDKHMRDFGVSDNKQVRDLWISGRRGKSTPHDFERMIAYSRAFIEYKALQEAAKQAVAQMASNN